MAEPAITGNDGVTFSFQSGDVESVRCTISNDLDHDSMAGSPATGAMLYDFNGVKKIITVTGSLSEAATTRTNTGTTKTIDEQRQWLEKQLNGAQEGTEFSSNYSSTYNGTSFSNSRVMKAQIEFIEEQEKPEYLQFTMILFVGDV